MQENEFEVYSGVGCTHQPENRLTKKTQVVEKKTCNPEKSGTKEPEIRQIVQRNCREKDRKKKKTPAAPPKWHAGQEGLQCNAEKRLSKIAKHEQQKIA